LLAMFADLGVTIDERLLHERANAFMDEALRRAGLR
jgi:hypothetical protein